MNVLRFCGDAGLVACGYTLAAHGVLWTAVPVLFTVACKVAAEEAQD